MKKIFFSLLAVFLVNFASAQYFQTGQDPASIRWRQMNTKNFQLIYPDYFEEQAQILAKKLEKVYEYGSFSLDHKPRKISVILHTQTVKSNGLVGWAPRRTEFYTTPHQSIYPQDWLEQLAIHEFRHVVQVDKLNSHVPDLIKVILGEQGTALIFGGYLPWWFIEGDAVVTETALSNYGRGRFPSFLMEHKAQVVEKEVFSYDKAFFGSYRDFVPDHYKLGYYLVGNARERYGPQLWEDVLSYTGGHPVSFSPVNKVLKDYTGFNKNELYYSVFDSLQTVWNKSDNTFEPAPFKVVSPPAKHFSNYIYNHWLNDSTLISRKKSFAEIPSFVKIEPNAHEKKILFPGTIFNESASFRDQWIIWSEQIPDPRWEHSGKSLLRLFNAKTKRKVEIEPDFKSFSPVISPDKTKIAVVETDFSNNYYLSVYKLPGGELQERFQTDDNNYFFSPEWLNNNEVAVVTLLDNGKRMEKIEVSSGKITRLLDKDMGDMKNLRAVGSHVYFISSYSGKNSLYRINLANGLVERIYEPRFGVESPAISPDGSKIVLSDYTADGFRLIQIQADSGERTPLSEVEKGTYPLAEALAEQEPGVPDFTKLDSVTFTTDKYSKISHLFNFHSWAPLSVDADAQEITPGASLMSQNKLGTAETVLGYEWDLTEKTGQFYGTYSFMGWYPVFDMKVSSGNRSSEFSRINQLINSQGEVIRQDTISMRFSWRENRGNVNVRLPLNFGKGVFKRYLQPGIQYNFTSRKRNASTPEEFQNGHFHSLGYRLYYHQLVRKSKLDMYSNFGIVLDANYRHSPGGTLKPGSIAAAKAVMYLPGLLKTHGIKLYGGGQQTKNNGLLGFSDIVKYPRGWGRINTTGLYSAAADYKMPLFYPDWNLGRWMYFRRFKVSIFGDYARLKGNLYHEGAKTGTFKKDISSIGAELTADVNILRFYAPADIGFRASYLPEKKNVYFDFLFSINFTSF